MKKTILTILTALVVTNGVYSQTEIQSLYENDNDLVLIDGDSLQQIRDIDKKCLMIKNNINSYKKIEKLRDTNGYKYVFINGKELQLIFVNYKEQNVDKKVEWYFYNEKLIYSEQIWTNIETNKLINDEKFYLQNEPLFSWIKFQSKPADRSTSEFKDMAAKLSTYAAKLKKESLE